MCKKLIGAVILIAAVFFSGSAMAMEFHHIGYEAISMGGAGVASSTGSFAAYYNPALLPEHKNSVNVSFSAMYGHREINIAEHIDNLADIDIDKTIADLENYYNGGLVGTVPSSVQQNVKTIKSELRALSVKNGIQMTPSIALGIQAGNFGFGAYMVSEASASAVIDSNHLDLIFYEEISGKYIKYNEVTNSFSILTGNGAQQYNNESIQYALDEKLTKINLYGLAYIEIPIAYGRRFATEFGNINVGGAFKIMPGYTFEYSLDIDSESGDLTDAWQDYYEESTTFGIDLGLLYKPSIVKNLSIGLVVKNLNTPEFDTATGGTIEAAPLVRTGIAYDLLGDSITLALDLDLTKNETYISNYYSQYIGGGINFHPLSWLSLRAGITQNIQESDEGTILTGGLGLGVKWLQLDVAGQYGTKSGTIGGNDIPRVAKIQIALVSKWN